MKQALRERVWDDLEARGVARFPYPPHGRIPNVAGPTGRPDRLPRAAAMRDERPFLELDPRQLADLDSAPTVSSDAGRPAGVDWAALDDERVAEIPMLAWLRER